MTTMHITKKGEVIELHESYNGIYIGDYDVHLTFEKDLAVIAKVGRFGYIYSTKHRELANELEKYLNLTDEILGECPAVQALRRIKKIEKLGYKVIKSNLDKIDLNDYVEPAYFVITK